jgi:hypothetical protein
MKTYTYYGTTFKQRKKGITAVLFICAAEDITQWGGVPRKSASFMSGFQRALNDDHRQDVSTYFGEDDKNICPTSIVVAFKPKTVKLENIVSDNFKCNPDSLGDLVKINIQLPDLETGTTPELAKFAADNLRLYIGNEVNSNDEDIDDESEESDQVESEGLSIGKSHLKTFLSNLVNEEWINERIKEDEKKIQGFFS